ncbi:MAG: CoA transferase [Alphaproteobacteria bacterium]|nr:MAG: CoA transferase [Alphaproteobacteria bacterium]
MRTDDRRGEQGPGDGYGQRTGGTLGEASPRPLEGLVVVDLSRVLAGPYCTMVLADLGARVIKVEHPLGGDDARHIGPFVETGDGECFSAYFASINRGKESIALDLKEEEDRRLFEALLARADVLVENFRPGVMDRFGYSWETLHARFPRLIYAAVSGFGRTGPYRDRPAYDMVVQAMGGILSVTGTPGGPPVRVGTSIGDITAGLFAVAGIEAALVARERDGRGRLVDIAMLDGQIAILENAIARYAASGQSPGPLGARHPSIAPFAAFRAADGYLVIAAGNDTLFRKLAETLDRPEIARDPRFASNDLRCRNIAPLTAEIEAALACRPVTHWLQRLESAGIPCGPINDIASAVNDPQVRARGMIGHAPLPGGGELMMAANPVRVTEGEAGMADAPVVLPAPPAFDEHRAAILAWLADEETA